MGRTFETPAVAGLRMAAFVLVYFAVTSASIYSTRFSGGLALVWLGTGILVGYLACLPAVLWPRALMAFFVASIVATALFGFGPGPAIPLAAVNVAEAAVIAIVLRRLRPRLDFLTNGVALAWLVAVAGVAGPVCAGAFGAAVVTHIMGGEWPFHMLQWTAGHGLGTLLSAPLSLLFARGSVVRLARVAGWRGYTDTALLALAVAGVATLSFTQSAYPLLFLPIVPLLAGCFLLGWIGAAVSVLLIAAVGTVSLAMGQGPFDMMAGGTAGKALFLQFYIAVMMLIALPVATLLAHRQLLMTRILNRDALHRLVSDHSDDAMLTLDTDGRVRYASRAAYGLSGNGVLVGRPLRDLVNGADPALIDRALAGAAATPGETQIHEHVIEREDGSDWFETKIRAITGTDGAFAGHVVVARRITNWKEREFMASQEAHTDPLTRLPNRRMFLKQLAEALEDRESLPFALAIVDIDDFRAVNERFGHDVGDLVLKHVAKTMRLLAADTVTFARLGGEEFGLLVRGGEMAQAAALCERLQAEIGCHGVNNMSGRAPTVSLTIGLTRIVRPCSVGQAMRQADDALLVARSAAGGKIGIAA